MKIRGKDGKCILVSYWWIDPETHEIGGRRVNWFDKLRYAIRLAIVDPKRLVEELEQDHPVPV